MMNAVPVGLTVLTEVVATVQFEDGKLLKISPHRIYDLRRRELRNVQVWWYEKCIGRYDGLVTRSGWLRQPPPEAHIHRVTHWTRECPPHLILELWEAAVGYIKNLDSEPLYNKTVDDCCKINAALRIAGCSKRDLKLLREQLLLNPSRQFQR